MSDKAPNYIEVPASEVRRRVAETIKWYDEGGRAQIEANYVVNQRNEYRKMYEGESHGAPWNRRPYSDDEIEALVDHIMQHGEDVTFLTGNQYVDMRMDTFDSYVQEMKNLAKAATADYTVQVRSFLWQLIVAHSTEPVATEPTS